MKNIIRILLILLVFSYQSALPMGDTEQEPGQGVAVTSEPIKKHTTVMGFVDHIGIDDEEMGPSPRSPIGVVIKAMIARIQEKKLPCEIIDFGNRPISRQNFIPDRAVKELASLCKLLPNLRILSFEGNDISRKGLFHLLPLLGREKLQYIVLDGNKVDIDAFKSALTFLSSKTLYRDHRQNLEPEEQEGSSPVHLTPQEAMHLMAKMICFAREHIDGGEAFGVLPHQIADAHRKFYASDDAQKIGYR